MSSRQRSRFRVVKYIVNYLDFDYSNSNYQTLVKEKKSSVEVFITNYEPQAYKQNKLPL